MAKLLRLLGYRTRVGLLPKTSLAISTTSEMLNRKFSYFILGGQLSREASHYEFLGGQW
ncbi:hypothetical protein BABINDRAFT_159444 [Babjeviella inositovora NRRL Y-12698]|uniref:Uncharacterized protein n=1 Tax=Babjeviella inositovora NRRL Y-12698 TaxID=984486 RepID=A0A1E3QZC0_9ASCO|nr:uncharacterized protein BABINDRAFT_159444 [Babjeviella inositovora NRRL Y-12698]ODQ82965.1 hypothetical protein BABINDRAFT_159444 [Babjeviella inositovora NRRL Y-12698]